MCRPIVLATLCLLCHPLFAELSEKEQDLVRDALKDFNQLVGKWNGNGQMKVRVQGEPTGWHEQVEWSWYFKDSDVGVEGKFTNGKYFKEGLLTYDPAKQLYVFNAVRMPDVKMSYTGKLEGDTYALTGTHPKTRQAESIEFKLIHYNAYLWNFKEAKRHLARVSCTVPGGFRDADAGPKCVVTGGLGTSQVTYEGKTYYVCCTGCSQAFAKNPAKFVAEFEAKQKAAAQ